MKTSSLTLDRAQILAFRRWAGGLTQRMPSGRRSLRRAAWAGLQDSMPRAALLSIHARVEGAGSSSWEDPSLVQLWGPRYQAYVVAARDVAIFTLGRLPDAPKSRAVAEDIAMRLRIAVGDERLPYAEAGDRLGLPANSLRYAAPTGTVLMRWDGARQPTIWVAPAPEEDPEKARKELARRFLHVFGPGTPEGFAEWAGIPGRVAARTFERLRRSTTAVRTPAGDGCILARDEPEFRAAPGPEAPARLLPSGDTYFLLHTAAERALLVPDAARRAALWTSRVWPGAVLADGEIVGTWRRAGATLSVAPWGRVSRTVRDAIGSEAAGLPLPGVGEISVRWER